MTFLYRPVLLGFAGSTDSSRVRDGTGTLAVLGLAAYGSRPPRGKHWLSVA